MRTLLLLLVLLFPLASRADEVDLTPRSRTAHKPPTLVLRAEGGSAFAPFGYAGACLSYLTQGLYEFELGGGAGFPGVQAGFAARKLFGDQGGYLVSEIYIAGNSRVNRGADDADHNLNAQAKEAKSSIWGGLGLGFEQRQDNLSFGVTANIVTTTASFTPHFAVHGGIGFGF